MAICARVWKALAIEVAVLIAKICKLLLESDTLQKDRRVSTSIPIFRTGTGLILGVIY